MTEETITEETVTGETRTRSPLRQPRVSVISVFHNRAGLVDASVGSLLAQRYDDLEIILVDDGSTDGTTEALSRFADDPRVVVRSHANIGFTPAIANAVAASTGAVIAVHGSGDLSHPDRIDRQVARLSSDPDIVAVGCWYRNEDADTGELVEAREPVVETDVLAQLARANFLSHGEVAFRRDAYDAVGGYREAFRFSQDYDLWLRLARIGRIDVVPEHLYVRYIRCDGVSRSTDRTLVQRMLAEFALQCADQRARTGRDVIDAYGPAGLLLWNPSPRMRREMAVHARRSLLFGVGMPDATTLLGRAAGARGPWESRVLRAVARRADRDERVLRLARAAARRARDLLHRA